ncbi:MAG: sulfatase [Fuerstiella sp.]
MRGVLVLAWFSLSVTLSAAERPNIVWISCEDISSHLGCYGDPHATTPHLDAFAEESVRYTQAFTVHGVCAPCRTGIITGMYPIGIGANHMRSKATLPDQIQCFPHYLKQAGYYCTNNSKTDYNFHWKEADVWDESSNKAHWKNRRDSSQPFFAVFNMTMTHESRIWPQNWKKVVQGVPPARLHDPDVIKVPPLYPNTPDVRAAHARLLDIIMVMDAQAGKYLQEIEDAGLTDDTIVIFWSDHGNGFARAKRWIYDSGTLVPMMARVPERFRVDGQGVPGSVSDQLINLIDLGPTVLNLAGVEIPEHMFGQPFLGPNLPEPRQYIHGARDRIDERFDMVRSVRDRQFRYLRNYNSWRPALQFIEYAENSVTRKEMRRLYAAGTLPRESAQFLNPIRPPEELYDLHADPWELHNLAADPAHAATLKRLQAECDRWQLEVRDAHLIPEAILDEEEGRVGNRWQILNGGDDGAARVRKLNQLARIANNPTGDAVEQLIAAAGDADPAARWWAITGLTNAGADSAAARQAVDQAASDESASVRVAAARALHQLGQTNQAVSLLIRELGHRSEFVRHAAINEIDEIGPGASAAAEVIRPMRNKKGYIGNIARHALAQFD